MIHQKICPISLMNSCLPLSKIEAFCTIQVGSAAAQCRAEEKEELKRLRAQRNIFRWAMSDNPKLRENQSNVQKMFLEANRPTPARISLFP